MNKKNENTSDVKPVLPNGVEEAQGKGYTVLVLTSEDDKEYYFKRPKQVDINRFLGTSSKGKLAVAVKNLVYDMAIHPPSDELKAELKDKPGLVVAWNNALQAEVGLNEDFTVKKL